jgi:hypothetical protein
MEKCVFHEDIKGTVMNHEVRIVDLEKKDVSLQEQISSLCKKLDMLIENIKTATNVILSVGGIFIASLVGFVFWYIQSLPR